MPQTYAQQLANSRRGVFTKSKGVKSAAPTDQWRSEIGWPKYLELRAQATNKSVVWGEIDKLLSGTMVWERDPLGSMETAYLKAYQADLEQNMPAPSTDELMNGQRRQDIMLDQIKQSTYDKHLTSLAAKEENILRKVAGEFLKTEMGCDIFETRTVLMTPEEMGKKMHDWVTEFMQWERKKKPRGTCPKTWKEAHEENQADTPNDQTPSDSGTVAVPPAIPEPIPTAIRTIPQATT